MTGYALYEGDCLDILPTLRPGSVDAVICDPPYGIGITQNDLRFDDNNWDSKPVDIPAFSAAINRLTSGFYAFFGQMPSMADWHSAAVAEKFHFCEHVVWVKRISTPLNRLSRGHESVFVYAAKGGRKTFYVTTGPYEDVKLPGVLFDTISIEGIHRYIADLQIRLETGRQEKNPRKGRLSHNKFKVDTLTSRSPKLANFTNVWSFLPPTQSIRASVDRHPTEKPLDVMVRLVEMLSQPGDTICDPFMGSGTTGVACVQTGRNFIGIERDARYFALAKERICEATQMADGQFVTKAGKAGDVEGLPMFAG